MMKESWIIFDFDGTIADSYATVIAIYNDICHKYKGMPILEAELQNIRDFEISKILVTHNIALYKLPLIIREIKLLVKQKIEKIPLVDGVADVLSQLHSAHYRLGIISSNNRQNIVNFLKINNLAEYFTFIHTGSNLFGKQRVIKKALTRYALEKDQVIYIGDEVRDIQASKPLGIKCLAVDWGYNSRKILTEYQPSAIFSHPEEIMHYCLNR